MQVSKKVISDLEKCYSIAPLLYKGEKHLLIAPEKLGACLLFDLDGNQKEVVFDSPGGVMTMLQIPGKDGQFLTTRRFYSPNDSKDAELSVVTAKDGKWEVKTLAKFPHIHRFDILERNGVKYIIACALKSGHEFHEDWTSPGKVYYSVLPEDLSVYNENNCLEFKVIKDNLTRNHGYYKILENGVETALVSSQDGIFRFYPPETKEGEWKVEEILDISASDATMVDINGDGENEMIVLSPFHGNNLTIYKKVDGKYEKDFEYLGESEFVHAIFAGKLLNKNTFVIGCRRGKMELLAFTFENGEYKVEVIDKGCGAANIFKFEHKGKDRIIATNREINEVAIYTFE